MYSFVQQKKRSACRGVIVMSGVLVYHPGTVMEELIMLWLLRKIFGAIALLWIMGWLVSFVSCFIDHKAAAPMIAVMIFGNVVGIPAGVIWAVLKIISVLAARRIGTPVTVATYPQIQVPATGVLQLAPSAPVLSATNATSTSVAPSAEPNFYTYSAPGMPMCPRCEERPAIFYCSTHQSAVCLECVAKHDQPEKCVYVPAFRAARPTVKATKAGSVLGIS